VEGKRRLFLFFLWETKERGSGRLSCISQWIALRPAKVEEKSSPASVVLLAVGGEIKHHTFLVGKDRSTPLHSMPRKGRGRPRRVCAFSSSVGCRRRRKRKRIRRPSRLFAQERTLSIRRPGKKKRDGIAIIFISYLCQKERSTSFLSDKRGERKRGKRSIHVILVLTRK